MGELREKVIAGLQCCSVRKDKDACEQCPYFSSCGTEYGSFAELAHDALSLLNSLSAFKSYFDDLYGEGLNIANYHLNGSLEPFDNFYDSAMEEYENA